MFGENDVIFAHICNVILTCYITEKTYFLCVLLILQVSFPQRWYSSKYRVRRARVLRPPILGSSRPKTSCSVWIGLIEDSMCSQSPILLWHRWCQTLIEFDGPLYWYLDASETGDSSRCPWGVWGTAGEKKDYENVTASLCLMFKGRGPILAPPLIKSINNLLPWRKITCQVREIWYRLRVVGQLWILRHFNWRSWSETLLKKLIPCIYWLNWVEWMRDERTLLCLHKFRCVPYEKNK